jgi:hypothetical protein
VNRITSEFSGLDDLPGGRETLSRMAAFFPALTPRRQIQTASKTACSGLSSVISARQSASETPGKAYNHFANERSQDP